MKRRRVQGRLSVAAASAVMAAALSASHALAQGVNFSTVATDGYGAGDINSCAVGINNLTTVGDYQFIAYYNNARSLMVGRRDLSTPGSAWTTVNSGLSISSTEITDDHNV